MGSQAALWGRGAGGVVSIHIINWLVLASDIMRSDLHRPDSPIWKRSRTGWGNKPSFSEREYHRRGDVAGAASQCGKRVFTGNKKHKQGPRVRSHGAGKGPGEVRLLSLSAVPSAASKLKAADLHVETLTDGAWCLTGRQSGYRGLLFKNIL